MKKIRNLLIILAFTGFLHHTGFAANYVVSNANNAGTGSLREAVASAITAGDVINIDANIGTITLLTPIIIEHAITINGPASGAIISGNNVTNLIEVIQIVDGTVTFNNIHFTKGRWNGKASIITNETGTLTLNSCTISDCENLADNGGAIYVAGNLNLINCTISNNKTANLGGAIGNFGNNEIINISNCTIVNNYSASLTGSGGIDLYSTDNCTIKNTILALNTNASGISNAHLDLSTITSGGFNLCNDNSTLTDATDIKNTDPMIYALGNNGGATPTHKLKPGSPALDVIPSAGSYNGSPVNDQRNLYRVSNYDIGAYEYISSTWNGTSWSNTPVVNGVDAYVDGNLTISADFACSNLVVNPGKQFTLASGTLTVNGDLTLKSDATGSASFIQTGTLTVVGSTNVEQYMTLGRNWYMSSPVSAAKTAVFNPDGTNRKYYVWDEPTFTFTPVTNTTTDIDLTRGHIGRIETSSAVTYTGGTLNNGDYSTGSLSRTGTTDIKRGYHLVGNPYPSFVDFRLLFGASTNIQSTMWVRTHNGAAYIFKTYNAALDESVPQDLTKFIAPMQSFWVRVNADGNTGAVNFTNAMRSHQSANLLKSEPIGRQTLRLNVSNGNSSDETLLCFLPDALTELDGYDSPKMSNDNASIPEIYSFAGKEQLVINGMNTSATAIAQKVGFRTGVSGQFTIKATQIKGFEAGQTIILEDKLTGTKQNLTEKPEYSFTATAGTTDNRFVLHFASTTTDVKDVETAEDIKIISAEGNIRISTDNAALQSAEYHITNIVGQVILNGKLSGSETVINNGLSEGVYIVGIRKAGEWNNTKVVVKP